MAKNIAHRGFSGRYPENTMLAFEKALEAGAEGIEFDVHLTKDGQLVIIHDELLDRTTDGKGLVADCTLEELRRLDASAGYKGVYGVNRIPTLEEYYRLIQGRDCYTNIELKTGVIWYPGIEEKVLEVIDGFGRRKDTVISSFNHFSILRMKELAPDLVCGFLEESRIIGPAAYCTKHGVECWHPLCYDMTEDVVKELKDGKPPGGHGGYAGKGDRRGHHQLPRPFPGGPPGIYREIKQRWPPKGGHL